ncbi:MAG TPA: hypothetical protein ENI07_04155 [Desulfobacterales bacterium]|nr:hypothetical protein [Desulfobacterales bacterium]
MMEFNAIGKRTSRIDAVEQVTGRAQFLPDLKFPNMLYGAILRSTIAHGRILNIDTRKAERVPGVKAIITSLDSPTACVGFYMGVANKECLVSDKVRFIGDDIAAVAAESQESAQEACSSIKVDLEPLPAVFDSEEALKPGAPLIHDDSPGNIAGEIHKEFGDVAEGFAASDKIFESSYITNAAAHCCLETRGVLAKVDAYGRLTIWSTTQIPHVLREMLSMVLNFPVGKIRVRIAHVGGGFGSRQSSDPIDLICAMLALKTKRPVRLIKDRIEEFTTDRSRYPMIMTLKTGMKSNGRIMVCHADILTDAGAYHDQGITITGHALSRIDHCYRIPCAKMDAKVVFTNKVYGGAFRGYGNPQITFAIESQMDEIAEELGIDPLELRIMNACHEGDVAVSGARITSCGLTESLNRGASAAGWEDKRGRSNKHGIGMACFVHSGGGGAWAHGGNFSSAFIKVEYDGSVDLITGVPDVGQGSKTTLALIAAEVIGIPVADVRVHSGDTGIAPVALGARGSRETFLGGNAVKLAAEDAKRQLQSRAASILGVPVEKLGSVQGRIFVKSQPAKFVTIAQAASKTMHENASAFPMGVPVIASACYTDPVSEMVDLATGHGNPCPTYAFGTQVAEVEVDTDTGQVTVLRVVAAHDVGKAIITPWQSKGSWKDRFPRV